MDAPCRTPWLSGIDPPIMSFKPELLSPAGNLDKLKAAVSYGADAVYLAGQKFGLRSAAENFTRDELEEGVKFAHEHGARVYVVLNSFPHDSDIETLPEFVGEISELNVDGVIASDMGVISVVARNSKLPIHLSTQASCLNEESGLFWKRLGVTRLILGREVSIRDAGRIKRATGLEVELFIHGSMCMAYSGNCTISNFTQGRDSNRGGCAQSCRFSYSLEFDGGQRAMNTYFMSSKDLQGIDLLPEFFKEGIDSVKVEGRMRSPLYAGSISKIYREAIDTYAELKELPIARLKGWHEELVLIPHRESMTGSLDSPADLRSTLNTGDFSNRPHYEYLGLVRKIEPGKYTLIEVRSAFRAGDACELVPFEGAPVALSTDRIFSSIGLPIESAKVNHLVRVPYVAEARVGQFVRKLRVPCS